MMDIVALECPNCGAKVVRQKNEYFATCPYCGVEVCFDEIKGEAAKGQIDELKDSVEGYKKEKEIIDEGRENLKRWSRWRNILYASITGLVFFGFFFIGLSTGPDPGEDTLVGIGSVIMIFAIMLFFSGPTALGLSYPDYDIVYGNRGVMYKVSMCLKLAGVSFGCSILGAFAAYIVLKLLGRA